MRVFSFRIPLRFLRGSYSRLALTVIALACGVALVCAIDLVNRAVLRAFTEVIDTMAGRAALQVTAGPSGLFPEEIAATVAAVRGVELAVPVVSATAFTTDESGDLLTVHGVEVTNEKAVRVYEARDAGGLELEDPLEFLNQADSVVLTRAFAARKGLGVGEEIELETPTGRKMFVVRGLLEPQGVARVYGGNLVVMDLYAAEAAFTRAGFVNRVDVVLEREAKVAEVAEQIGRVLPEGLGVETPSQRKADLNAVMQALHVLLRGVGLVGLIAAFLIAFNRLTTVFDARSWQLGVMRAVGLQSRTLRWELLKESLLLGSMGVGLGIPAGIALGHALLPMVARTTAVGFKLVAPDADMSVSGVSLLLALALGITAAVTAALIPARRASQVSPAEGIRGRGLELHVPVAPAFWIFRGAIVATVLGAVALQALTKQAAWGLLATAAIAIAAALAARPFLLATQRPWARFMERHTGPRARFASAVLTRNPRRAGLTVAMLAVGLGGVLWLRMLGASFERSVTDSLATTMRADVVVTSLRVAAGFLEAPVDDSIAQELSAIPGARKVVGERVIDWEYAGGPIAIDAFDAAYFRDPSLGQLPLHGRHADDVWEVVAAGTGVLVSSNFSLHLDVGVGDVLVLDTPSGARRLPVVGITTVFISPRGSVVMSRALLRELWHDSQVNHLFVAAAPGTSAESLGAGIARSLGRKYSLRILSARDLVEYFGGQVRKGFLSLDVLAAMALFVVLAGMADTLAAGVLERTREIGALRAIGAQSWQVRRIVVLESLVLGANGIALALVVGFALGGLWVEQTFPYLLGWVLDLEIPYAHVAAVALLCLLVCFAASAIPASRAGRIEPGEALRYE